MKGTAFFKMTGSGNDFIMLDGRASQAERWTGSMVSALCDRRNGVGADGGDGDYAVTGRATVNPWYDQDGAYALHLGLAGSVRDLPELNAQGAPLGVGGLERVRFASRPEIRPNAPNFADTGLIVADSQRLVGLEFGLGLRRVLVQAEYVCAFVCDAVLPAPAGAPGEADLSARYFTCSASHFAALAFASDRACWPPAWSASAPFDSAFASSIIPALRAFCRSSPIPALGSAAAIASLALLTSVGQLNAQAEPTAASPTRTASARDFRMRASSRGERGRRGELSHGNGG